MHARYDVVIAGGGLAGLTLARQLRQEAPELRVLVAEKRTEPAPEAAFKVGESSVEIGAHYLSRVVGLDDHLRTQQLPKLGLRYFFTRAGNQRVEERPEAGPRLFPRIPSFQIDRGRLENFLVDVNRADGIDVLTGCRVQAIRLGGADADHATELLVDGTPQVVRSRWVVDATGRHGLLRRQLALRKDAPHGANAVWFRVNRPLRVDDWSADAGWRAQVPSGERWLSTVHFMGRGYWTWFIPLASGSTSVGIVADGDLHPYRTVNRLDRALAWLHAHEPQCAAMVEGHRDGIEDFLGLQHYAHGCTQMYGDRWALVGEAGPFTDPFYSPGSDFIAIGNDLTTELIVRDQRGLAIDTHAAYFSRTYLHLFDAFLRLYGGQYPIMGHAQVMTAKVAWDNACYWGVSALLYFQRRYRDLAYMQSIEPLLYRFFLLHARMQRRLRDWYDSADGDLSGPGYVNFMDVPWLRALQDGLDAPLDDAALTARLQANVEDLERFADVLLGMRDGASLARDVAGFDHVAALQFPRLGVPAAI